ncbi:general transcription factor 3C polypeptide 3 [Tanacetum coccineum]
MRRRGRRVGSRNKLSPEITRKLGDATLYYVHGRYEEAITLLKELILLSPNLPDSYHTLGMIYNAMGDKKRALAFYMLAVHLTPKDASIWKLLVTWSLLWSSNTQLCMLEALRAVSPVFLEQGNRGQACYCLDRAIRADPEDTALRYHRASLYVELGEHHKAAESYEQIWQVRPKNVEALKTAATLYQKGGKHERSVNILENYMNKNPKDADLSVVNLLASMLMSANEHEKALHHIEYAQRTCSSGKELPAELLIKAGICHVHLGNMKNAEDFFSVFTHENVSDCAHLVIEVADSLMSVKHHESALKYCLMFEGSDVGNKGLLYLNIGRCYSFLGARTPAIHYLYKALHERQDDIDARLDLVSLLLEEDKEDESISVLSPPLDSESRVALTSDRGKPWWTDVKIKLKLSYIYKSKGLTEAFVNAICPFVQETLFIETIQRKFKGKTKKRISNSELEKRARVLDADQNENVFQGFRPVASSLDLAKGLRAKKLLEKRRLEREERRAEAQKAGVEWQSDNDSDDESRVYREPPLPDLLKDEKHIMLIIDLCKGLISIKKYWEALEVITSSLKLGHNTLTTEKQAELQSLGAQISYNIDAPKNGWDCARHIVTQNPYSFAAWNCYYKATSRGDGLVKRCGCGKLMTNLMVLCIADAIRSNVEKQNSKFLRLKIMKHNDCIPPLIIKGHQLTAISQHQAAAINYLEAYKLMPENALINLCVGTSLINLALGNRLQNRHQCVLQGLAFLYNNLRLSENSQESLYNLARAYHHVGLVSVAVTYYEKVLAIHQKDLPIPRLPNDGPEVTNNLKPGYCDLKREAAYNLHLIYKNSGSVDLARQVLKDYCSL